MNNSDQDLKRILNALRDTEPPSAMQQRVLAAVAQREAAPSRPFLWSFAALAATVGIAAILAIHPMPRGTHSAREIKAPPEASVSQVAATANAPQPLVPHASAKAPAGNIPAQTTRRPHQLLCDCDPTALAEANAPSMPAPELPLTEQEKLLRRIARHPDPVEVAELTPAAREAKIAADSDDFKAFFTPPARIQAPE
jgi:hypothetical protein